jgi:hypothetical protein
VSAENHLTAEQLAALVPGDVVTIESGVELSRRRYRNGTVARVTDRHIVVRYRSYIECYGLRDGLREGGAGRAELVNDGPAQEHGGHGRTRRIDRLYRDWARNRTDLERLQRLNEAISEVLEEKSAGAR